MSNQEGMHAAVRVRSSTAKSYNSDWLAMMASDAITVGNFNERQLQWLNLKLVASYTTLQSAQQAFAVSQGFNTWGDMNTFTLP
jgi:hypothetical protein